MKRARNVMTLEKKTRCGEQIGAGRVRVAVAILVSTGFHGAHRFLCFVGRRLCYVCLQPLVVGQWLLVSVTEAQHEGELGCPLSCVFFMLVRTAPF